MADTVRSMTLNFIQLSTNEHRTTHHLRWTVQMSVPGNALFGCQQGEEINQLERWDSQAGRRENLQRVIQDRCLFSDELQLQISTSYSMYSSGNAMGSGEIKCQTITRI